MVNANLKNSNGEVQEVETLVIGAGPVSHSTTYIKHVLSEEREACR